MEIANLLLTPENLFPWVPAGHTAKRTPDGAHHRLGLDPFSSALSSVLRWVLQASSARPTPASRSRYAAASFRYMRWLLIDCARPAPQSLLLAVAALGIALWAYRRVALSSDDSHHGHSHGGRSERAPLKGSYGSHDDAT